MKENVKHTPGPWKVKDELPDGDIYILPESRVDGNSICRMDDDAPEQMLANAALIAAAPDLLAACEGMIDLCKTLLLKDCGFYSPDNNGYIQTARWAIAKAKGE